MASLTVDKSVVREWFIRSSGNTQGSPTSNSGVIVQVPLPSLFITSIPVVHSLQW